LREWLELTAKLHARAHPEYKIAHIPVGHRDFLKLLDLQLTPIFAHQVMHQLSRPQIEYFCCICATEIKRKPVQNFMVMQLVNYLASAQGSSGKVPHNGGEDWSDLFS